MTDTGMRFVAPEDVETQVFEWGTIKWLSEPRVTNAQNFSAGVVLLAPGKGHTRHNHPGVEEILYVVSGQGIQMVEDEAGQPVRRPVTAPQTRRAAPRREAPISPGVTPGPRRGCA